MPLFTSPAIGSSSTLWLNCNQRSMNGLTPSPLGMPVFDATIRANRPGWRGSSWSPASPPQSWQYSVMSVRSEPSSHWPSQSTWLASV